MITVSMKLHSNLEFASLGHIFYTFKRFVFFTVHIKSIHLQSRNGQLRYTELNINWWIRFGSRTTAANNWYLKWHDAITFLPVKKSHPLLTVPRIFGNLVTSTRPTSQWRICVFESNEYFPWFGTNKQLSTFLGMHTSNLTDSTVRPNVVFGPTVISNLPCSPVLNTKLCRI